MSFRAAAIALVVLVAHGAKANSLYLALGDSVAFGLHKDPNGLFGYNVPSDGDRGYVSVVADRIGQIEGERPTVYNFALPGETSTSFTDTSNPFRAANTNYGFPAQSQEQQMEYYLDEPLSSSPVGTVSFAIGANDFLSLSGDLQTDPDALALAFASITTRYNAVLSAVRASAPDARLILPGYYNPYAVGEAKHDQAALVVGQLDALIQGFAVQYHGHYVDFYNVIEDRQDTLLYPGDIHPNDAGYAALGQAAAQAVPEPASLLGVGLAMGALLRRRVRRA